MNRQTSIALHLAQAVRQHGYVSTDIRWPGRVESMGDVWKPHTDLSQWAECVLWAASNGMEPMIMRTIASAWSDAEMKEISVDSADDIKAATLEAIARATGWEESK